MLMSALTWLGLGLLGYALTLHAFTTAYPYMKHRFISCLMIPMGVFGLFGGLIASIICESFGLQWKPFTKEQRWEVFLSKGYGSLGRGYFEEHHG